MVEHNLAKVGVASSNLVSRSIVCIFVIFSTLLFSKDKIIIKNYYCISHSTIFLQDIAPHQKKNIKIFQIPKNLANYKIPSIDIISAIKKIATEHIIDKSGGIVTFDRQCNINFDKFKIIKTIKSIFHKKYRYINIKSIFVKPVNSFPTDFENYKIKKISIPTQNLYKNSGIFSVLYQNTTNKISRIYFRFKIIAKITLLKARNNIANGKILSRKNYKRVIVEFKKIPMNFIEKKELDGYISRTFIRKGQILTTFVLKKKKLIQKRDIVTAIIKSGALELEFMAKALNSGNKNEYIKVVNSSGKIFRVKVIGEGTVEVQ